MLSFLNPLESLREMVKLLDVLEPVSHEFRHVEPAGNHNSRRWPCVCRRGNLSTTYSRHTCPWWRYEYLSPLRTEISPKWGQQFCTSCCWIKDATIKARCLMSTTRKEGIIVNTWIMNRNSVVSRLRRFWNRQIHSLASSKNCSKNELRKPTHEVKNDFCHSFNQFDYFKANIWQFLCFFHDF